MRKYRSWLMGLGIGLIIGASMLQLIQLAQDQAVMVAEEPITREQLNDEAEKAGLVLLTEEQLAAKVEDAVAAARQVEAPGKQEATGGIKESNSALKPPESSKKPEPEPTSEPKTVTLSVTYGMTLTEVANELEKLGIIKDADDFIHKARSIAKKMSIGKSAFTGKPTYKEIMNELTREK